MRSIECPLKAKFHYTGPTRRADPHGVSRRPGPQKSPCGSGRARVVVEVSYNCSYFSLGVFEVQRRLGRRRDASPTRRSQSQRRSRGRSQRGRDRGPSGADRGVLVVFPGDKEVSADIIPVGATPHDVVFPAAVEVTAAGEIPSPDSTSVVATPRDVVFPAAGEVPTTASTSVVETPRDAVVFPGAAVVLAAATAIRLSGPARLDWPP